MFLPGIDEGIRQKPYIGFPFWVDSIGFFLFFQQHKLLNHPIQDIPVLTGQSDSRMIGGGIPGKRLSVCSQHIIIISAFPFGTRQGEIECVLYFLQMFRITQSQHRIRIHQAAYPTVRHPIGIFRAIVLPLVADIVTVIDIFHHTGQHFTHRHQVAGRFSARMRLTVFHETGQQFRYIFTRESHFRYPDNDLIAFLYLYAPVGTFAETDKFRLPFTYPRSTDDK